MLVGLHKFGYGRSTEYLDRCRAVLDHNGIKQVILDASDEQFWRQVSECDAFVFHWAHTDHDRQMALTIIPVVEKYVGVKCFPDMATCWCYDDKIREYLLLKQAGFPAVESRIFWDRERAMAWAQTATYPVVFKLKGGAGSSNVVLVKDKAQAAGLIERMFGGGIKTGAVPASDPDYIRQIGLYRAVRRWAGKKRDRIMRIIHGEIAYNWQRHKNYVFFQKFLAGNSYDTRVVVIGNRALALRRNNRPGDFRASGSGLIEFSPDKIDRRCVELAFEVSGHFGFKSMGYDFLCDADGGHRICEMSYTFSHAVYTRCPGYWDARMNWHPGHNWPEYFQLVDLLGLPDLKHPPL